MNKREIKALLSDVDGTLTDGRMYYTAQGQYMQAFDVKDGYGIKRWRDSGRIFHIVTAKSLDSLRKRASDLGLPEPATGISDKVEYIDRWLAQNNLNWQEIAYIGDDTSDLDALRKSGFSAAPADAVSEVIDAVVYTCQKKGGRGCVREVIDYLLTSD